MKDLDLTTLAEEWADKHFLDDVDMLMNRPWPEAKERYKDILVNFVRIALSHKWECVEEHMPKNDVKMLVRVPASEFFPEYYAIAHFDGEDWIEAERNEVIRPSHCMSIPRLQLDTENEEKSSMKLRAIVTEQEREMCRLAPNSLTADIVRFRLALLRVRREIKRMIDKHDGI